MSKTADLRRLITAQLNMTAGATYFRQAPKDAEFPYKVFDFGSVYLGDLARDDYELIVDVWDKAEDTKAIDIIADEIEEILGAVNLPQETILPTFYRESRFYVDDDDKDIQHVQVRLSVQNYAIPPIAQN